MHLELVSTLYSRTLDRSRYTTPGPDFGEPKVEDAQAPFVFAGLRQVREGRNPRWGWLTCAHRSYGDALLGSLRSFISRCGFFNFFLTTFYTLIVTN
jgi:hypothetical protein